MTSFAASVKKELTMLEVHPMHARAELSAFVRMNGSLRLVDGQVSLDCSTENAAIARRIYQLITYFFETPCHLVVRRKMKLKKNNVYIVRIKEGADNLLSQLGIFTEDGYQAHAPDFVMKDEQSQRSYLRGAFLAAGSVNSPETSRYHLEIRSVYEDHNDDLVELMNNFDLNARPLERKNHWITYLKESEKISDFLALTGATNSMLRFEDTRIVRDMRNSVNRLVNCENANLNKTAKAASKQISNIQLIEESIGLDSLDEKSRELAYLRLDYPEASLKELGEKVANGPISKSGVNHRMRKINQTADRIRKKASSES